MILRKPYALLIKNFKKIHLLLCILMAYVAYESANLLTFFKDFISTGTFTRTPFSLSSTYINIYMFLVATLIAVIVLIIYILMNQKKKPKLLYFLTIAFYLILEIYFFQMYNTLAVIEVSSISPRSLRIIRDISSIVCYIQYALILIMAVRAVGFDIKKFNFGEDLAELEIDVSDNEEFELTVGIDPDKIERRLRRGRREFKYFVVENFFVLSIIFAIAATSFGVGIFLNKEVYNKIYKQTESFKAGYFINTVNNCFYTDMNQRGTKIGVADKIFVVTRVTFNNRDIYPSQLGLDSINLTSGGNIYSPIITRYQSFSDLGAGYTNQTIAAGEQGTFILVFEVDKTADFDNLIFRYRESLKITSTRLEAKYKRVKLDGAMIDTISKVREVNLGAELSLDTSALGNSKINISDAQIGDSFIYDASYCYNGTCSISKSNLTLNYVTTQKTLLKISPTYLKDANITLANAGSMSTVITSYGFVRYTIGDKTYSSEMVNKTPSNYRGADLYYQVPIGVKNANSVELVLRIRDKEFVYKLK